jgi:hypothetical protein
MNTKRISTRGLPAATLAATLAFAWAPQARAQAPAPTADADTSFQEAMQLRSAGRDAEACPKFAESKRLAPAIGVTMYLAACYEKTGRNASAWREFRDAERMAREKNDKRADVAAQRAEALEPKLSRLIVSAPADAGKAGATVLLDGAPLGPEFWNAALAVDAGDHVVIAAAAGQAPQTLNVTVAANATPTTVNVGPVVAPPPPPPAAPPPAAAAPAAAVAATPEAPPPHGDGATARWVGVGLMVAGAAGIGIGTFLVTSKVRPVMPDGTLCDPHLRPHAIPEAILAFAAGGVALVSGGILYYVNRPGRWEVSLAPSVLPGGGGALLTGAF